MRLLRFARNDGGFAHNDGDSACNDGGFARNDGGFTHNDTKDIYVIARSVVSRSPERNEGDEAIPRTTGLL